MKGQEPDWVNPTLSTGNCMSNAQKICVLYENMTKNGKLSNFQ